MKPVIITSLLSLVLGFAGGWMFRSASSELETVTRDAPATVERKPPAAPPRTENPDVPAVPEDRDPIPDRTGEVITRDDIVIPESAIKADQAKWLRLVEVLGLSKDQSKAVAAAIEETQPSTESGESPDASYQRAGEQLEKNILAILDPTQQEAFRKFQLRVLENQVETTAHRDVCRGTREPGSHRRTEGAGSRHPS